MKTLMLTLLVAIGTVAHGEDIGLALSGSERVVVIPKFGKRSATLRPVSYLRKPDCPYVVGTVIEVIDGDSFRFRNKYTSAEVVVNLGVDAPELDQPFGPQAKAKLKELLGDGTVYCNHSRSQKSILLFDVYVGRYSLDQRNALHIGEVGQEMIRQGFAYWRHLQNMPSQPTFIISKSGHFVTKEGEISLFILDTEARAKRKGMWNQDLVVHPWAWEKHFRKAGMPTSKPKGPFGKFCFVQEASDSLSKDAVPDQKLRRKFQDQSANHFVGRVIAAKAPNQIKVADIDGKEHVFRLRAQLTQAVLEKRFGDQDFYIFAKRGTVLSIKPTATKSD